MDPNEALKQIRAIVAQDNDAEMDEDAFYRLKILFEGLDHWVSHGGFLPVDWDRKR